MRRYEWVEIDTWTAPESRVVRYSDAGYGVSAAALRDGLIAAEGMPEADPANASFVKTPVPQPAA
jgi:hypothetical protein